MTDQIREYYILLTLKYGVNLLNTPVPSILRQICTPLWQRLAACQRVFPWLRYSDTYPTSAHYPLTQIQKCRFLLVMECKHVKCDSCTRVDIFTQYFKVINRVYMYIIRLSVLLESTDFIPRGTWAQLDRDSGELGLQKCHPNYSELNVDFCNSLCLLCSNIFINNDMQATVLTSARYIQLFTFGGGGHLRNL